MEDQTLVATTSEDSRSLAMWMHLGPLLAGFAQILLPIPFLGVGTALFLYQTHREKSALVRENGRESLNFQLTLSLLSLFMFVLVMIFAGRVVFDLVLNGGGSYLEPPTSGISIFIAAVSILGIMTLVWLVSVVLMIVGSLRAREGVVYRYPVSWRLIKGQSETETPAQPL